jgi:autoinducer 2-degrading protein
MSKLAVIGTIEVHEGCRPEVLPAVLAHRERSLKDEPGTLQFEVLVPAAEPNRIMLYELYSDAAAFAAHMKGSSMAQVTQEVGSKVVSLTGVKCIPGAEFPA